MVMNERHEHPLDIDLLAYAAGDVGGSAVSILEGHLGGCLLCRIRLSRIQRHDTFGTSPPLDAARPSVSTALLDALGPDQEAPAPKRRPGLARGPRAESAGMDQGANRRSKRHTPRHAVGL